MLEIIFIGAVFGIGYAYFGYPFSLYLLSLVRTKPIQRSSIEPSVTLIITAFNEEKRIRQKLENVLVLIYLMFKVPAYIGELGEERRRPVSMPTGLGVLASVAVIGWVVNSVWAFLQMPPDGDYLWGLALPILATAIIPTAAFAAWMARVQASLNEVRG